MKFPWSRRPSPASLTLEDYIEIIEYAAWNRYRILAKKGIPIYPPYVKRAAAEAAFAARPSNGSEFADVVEPLLANWENTAR